MRHTDLNISWIKGTGFLIMWILLLGIGGCISLQSTTPITHFYTLSYDPPPKIENKPLPVSLRVEIFQTDPAYDTTQMVYSESPLKVHYYNYHKWYARPGILIPAFLTRDLRSSGLFKGVFGSHYAFDVTYLVTGHVDAFYEWDLPSQWQAKLQLTIALLAAHDDDPSRRLLFQKTYRAQVESLVKTPQAMASAMSEAQKQISETLILDIYRAISSQEAQEAQED